MFLKTGLRLSLNKSRALKTYHIQLLGGDTVAAPDKAMFSLNYGEVATGAWDNVLVLK